ncbi:hypothetical protein lbkm_0616 [Lachnospiraceae bacterium KM106-2]|nr:hypothetical protein lbkm_0616 [Lachnospiraceae bacterium KM106-2]
MKTMSFLVWIFPIIYMLHDFEEIIMAEVWGSRYHDEINICFPKNQPFGLNYVHTCQTPSFASGVYIFFTIYTIISFFSVFFQNYILWIGAFIPIILHFVIIHILICLKFKHYVPGLLTSVIFLIPSLLCIIEARQLLPYSSFTWILASISGTILSMFMMKFLHRLLKTISLQLKRYRSTE